MRNADCAVPAGWFAAMLICKSSLKNAAAEAVLELPRVKLPEPGAVAVSRPAVAVPPPIGFDWPGDVPLGEVPAARTVLPLAQALPVYATGGDDCAEAIVVVALPVVEPFGKAQNVMPAGALTSNSFSL